MWYKLKRILIYPDGVTEKQVYPNLMNRPTGVKWWLYLMNWNGNDSSWNGHNGTWWTFTSWKFWQCLNATSSSVIVSSNSDFNPVDSEPFSIWFWFKPNQWLNDWTIWWIMSKSSTWWWWWSWFAFWKWSWTQVIRFTFWSSLWTGTWQVYDLSALTITANVWSHICLTYDGTTVKLYQNWTYLGSKSMPNRWTWTNSGNLDIWHTSGEQPFYAKSSIDEFFYMKNYCLSQAEINRIQNGFKS